MDSQTQFQVEPVQVGDLKDVMRLAWRSNASLLPFDFFDQIARHQREYFRVVRDQGSGHVLGFVIAAQQPESHQNFLLLVIDPQFQGLGVRRALLGAVQEILKREGHRSFDVEVPSQDTTMVDFYKANGFEVVGVERLDQGDRVRMAKKMDSPAESEPLPTMAPVESSAPKVPVAQAEGS